MANSEARVAIGGPQSDSSSELLSISSWSSSDDEPSYHPRCELLLFLLFLVGWSRKDGKREGSDGVVDVAVARAVEAEEQQRERSLFPVCLEDASHAVARTTNGDAKHRLLREDRWQILSDIFSFTLVERFFRTREWRCDKTFPGDSACGIASSCLVAICNTIMVDGKVKTKTRTT